MKSILDPTFAYTPSYATDLAAKFKRMAEEKQAAAAPKQSEYVSTIIQLFNERRREEK